MMGWLAVAVILFIAEMFLGTFYLLVVCAAFVAAGLSAGLLQTPFAVNMTIAAVCSVVGIAVVRLWQKKQPVAEAVDDLDLGQVVVLQMQMPDGLWQVQYRGTRWQARVQGDAKAGQRGKIIGKDGNVLIVGVA